MLLEDEEAGVPALDKDAVAELVDDLAGAGVLSRIRFLGTFPMFVCGRISTPVAESI